MKTVRPRSGGASPFQLCEKCYPALARWVWIVPGEHSVTAQCSGCGIYLSLRDVVPGTLSPPVRERWGGVCMGCSGG